MNSKSLKNDKVKLAKELNFNSPKVESKKKMKKKRKVKKKRRSTGKATEEKKTPKKLKKKVKKATRSPRTPSIVSSPRTPTSGRSRKFSVSKRLYSPRTSSSPRTARSASPSGFMSSSPRLKGPVTKGPGVGDYSPRDMYKIPSKISRQSSPRKMEYIPTPQSPRSYHSALESFSSLKQEYSPDQKLVSFGASVGSPRLNYIPKLQSPENYHYVGPNHAEMNTLELKSHNSSIDIAFLSRAQSPRRMSYIPNSQSGDLGPGGYTDTTALPSNYHKIYRDQKIKEEEVYHSIVENILRLHREPLVAVKA